MAMIEPNQQASSVERVGVREESTPDPVQSSQGVNLRRALVVGADWLAIIVGLALSRQVPFGDAISPAMAVVFGLALWGAMVTLNLYNSRLVTARSVELGRVIRSGVRAMLFLGLASVVVAGGPPLRAAIVTLAVTVAVVCVEREAVRLWFARRRRSGVGLWASVLVAGADESADLVSSIRADRGSPHIVVDLVDPREASGVDDLLTRTLAACRKAGAQGAIVVESWLDAKESNALVRGLLEAGLYVDLTSNLMDISADRLATRSLGNTMTTWIAPRPRDGWRGRAKRAFDLSVAGAALVAASPVFLALALAVKVTSPGPIFFRQERVGRYGEPFKMIKFRSMVVDAEERLRELEKANEGAGPLFKMKEDPRVTSLGRFMRKTSLDELPQLLNVLANEMSLVGPRPALKAEMADWDPELYARLQVKPGITGMWQVSGRSGTSFEEYTRLDLYYVHNWSLFVDLGIMAKTIPAVVRSEGAY